MISNYDKTLEQKWGPVLEGIDDSYQKKVCAVLMENQAKSIVAERIDEADSPTTVGKLGTFQKFAFPLVRRVYPQLIANNIVGVQPMQGPVSQIFYLGHDRTATVGADGNQITQTVYSKYNLTYRGLSSTAHSAKIGGTHPTAGTNNDMSGIDIDVCGSFQVSDVMGRFGTTTSPSGTYGGKIASFPVSTTTLGWSVSAGEKMSGGQIPELNFHIEQQPVVARTRKMRALWTLEAQQDLRAYHNLDLEGELTGLLSKELTLEIDREIIEDLRMIAYNAKTPQGFWDRSALDMTNSNNFAGTGNRHIGSLGAGGAGFADSGDPVSEFTPASYLYDFDNNESGNTSGQHSNVFVVDLTASGWGAAGARGGAWAPQHIGHIYANLLAAVNFASQDVYKTTMRGPANWIVTSPVVASMLESAAKLEGGINPKDGPTNFTNTSIEYKGKFMGRYDLYVDPLYPDDEVMLGYKGSNAMDSGYVYAPYIPLQALPTITDPNTFQPRKGILTRYGKALVAPGERFYRILRLVGPTAATVLYTPFLRSDTGDGPGNYTATVTGG